MQANRRNIMLLFITLVVIMMGFGMVIPILPFLIEKFGASGSDLGLLMAVYATAQFIFAPIWGKMSDRYGRKPILMVGVLGNAISQFLFGVSTSLWMLFVARALAGILSSATLPTAMAYIGDSTADEDRGGGMGIIGAAMGVGMVLGPGLAGWLATWSLSFPFFVAAGLSVLTLFLIFFTLPESLPQSQRRQLPRDGRGSQFSEMWQALFGPIGFLLVLAFVLSFALTNFEGIFGLYVLNRFGYGPQQVGLILTVVGLISAVIQGMLTGPLTRRWGEGRLIQASLLASAAGFILMLMAVDFTTVLLTVSIFIISNSMLRPAIASLTSRRAPGGQGIAMGLNNSFMSLGRIVGPVWAGYLFDLNMSAPYISGGIVMLIGFTLCLRWLQMAPSREPATEIVPHPQPK